MESSDSEGYEDVMSGDEDLTHRNPWTAKKKTPPRAVPLNGSVTKVHVHAYVQ